MMHGTRSRTSSLVAMKPANKAKEGHCGGVSGGERSGVGGAKGGGKGNAHQHNTYWTQSQSRVTRAGAYTATRAVTHPRWGPYAGKPHVRIWAGGVR
jgi:hypothetical protein